LDFLEDRKVLKFANWVFLLLLLIFRISQAQVATSSFDPTIIGENPAVAASREFGVFSPQSSYTQVDQNITEDTSVAGVSQSTVKCNRLLQIQRYELIYAGKKGRFVPEIYLSENFGYKIVKSEGSVQKQKNKVENFNNHFNLAYEASNSFKLGIKFFTPTFNYKTNESYTLTDSSVRTFSVKQNASEFGTGLGFTYLMGKYFSIGYFYSNIKEKNKFNSTYKEGSADPTSASGNIDTTNFQSGTGISFQSGGAKSEGIRIELSWSTMKFGYEQGKQNNAMGRISIEASKYGFTGGGTITQITGNFLNYRYLIDYIMADNNYKFVPLITYGGFIGYKNKNGGSYSGFLSYSSGKSEVDLFGKDQEALVTRLNLGLSYAYYF
jgi:hypothetical protein